VSDALPKVGLDDFIGHYQRLGEANPAIAERLFALAKPQLAAEPPARETDPEPALPYRVSARGIEWLKTKRDDDRESTEVVLLTTFTALILADVTEDDGATRTRRLDMEARISGKPPRIERFSLTGEDFLKMAWPVEQLGVDGIVSPGNGVKDRARHAIMTLSRRAGLLRRTVYLHTGWRLVPISETEEVWAYLTSSGAIGPNGRLDGIEVRLPRQALSRYSLPDPPDGDELREAVRASLTFVDVAPDRITLPLYALMARAPLAPCDFAIHVWGSSGSLKSEIATRIVQHFGAGWTARQTPANWGDTDNSIRGLAFNLKEIVMLVDDFAPQGSRLEITRLHAKADAVIRSIGNLAGKGRMRDDTSQREDNPPRTALLSTGEEVPRGDAIQARALSVNVGPRDVSSERLTQLQTLGAQGVFASAMAGYVRWLAGRYPAIQAQLPTDLVDLRASASRRDAHRRLADVVANLALGLRTWLQFAQEISAITAEEAEALWSRADPALASAASAHSQRQTAADPANRFVDLVKAGVAAGRFHLSTVTGGEPEDPAAWGWEIVKVGQGEFNHIEWRGLGEWIGAVDGQHVYLHPTACYSAVQSYASRSDSELAVESKTLWKRMADRGLLVTPENDPEHLSVRVTVKGVRERYVKVRASTLGVEPSDRSGPGGPIGPEGAESRSEPGPSLPVDGPIAQPSQTDWDGTETGRSGADTGQEDGPMGGPIPSSRGTDSDHVLPPLRPPAHLAPPPAGPIGSAGPQLPEADTNGQ
jgi:hypothetical protein